MTNPNLTEIAAVVDRSGSMMIVKRDTEGAFDGYVADQRTKPGEAKLTLVQFDTHIDTVYRSKPIAEVPPVIINPRGLTALYDAIGTTIVDLGARLADLEEDQRPGQVVVVILTDGEENASKEWKKAALKKLIEEQTTKYGWVFLFLGANQDAVFAGGEIGIQRDYALTYDVGSMDAAVASASGLTTNVRGGNYAGFSQADRDAAVGQDVSVSEPKTDEEIFKAQKQAAVERAKQKLNRGRRS